MNNCRENQKNKEDEKNNYRYCARVLVQAQTPLKIGTGEAGLNTDEQAAIDSNGLPFIPGTAICGVLRHSFYKDTTNSSDKIDDSKKTEGLKEENKSFSDKIDQDILNDLFGYQKGKNGTGSRLIFSEARIVGKQGKVIDSYCDIDFLDPFYSKFHNLPIRDHCKINYRGVTDKDEHGKFDSQVVFKGSRFMFDIELIGKKQDKKNWKCILNNLNSETFYIGGGTRKGFGKLEIIALDENIYNLKDKEDLKKYLEKSSKLDVPDKKLDVPHKEQDVPDKEKKLDVPDKEQDNQFSSSLNNFVKYELCLKPDDFFLFSSGYGDQDVDLIAKKELCIEWKNEKPEFTQEKVLIPATSVKGAVSHRTAFHYNRLTKVFIDKIDLDDDIQGYKKSYKKYTDENNEAVKALFGFAKDSKGSDEKKQGRRGKVFFSDVFLDETKEKIFNHVAIDRYTGGAMDGALFDEKAVNTQENVVLNIIAEKSALEDENIKKAFECTLKDITTGMLALGGSTMHGHGCFNGTLKIDGILIKDLIKDNEGI